MTVIYKLDAGCQRLLWMGRWRSQATLRRGLKALGPEVVLDRFHITSHLNQAVDQVLSAESTRLGAKS